MTKRKRVFITSLIILLLVIGGGFYYLFFSGQLGTLADLVTGPDEKVVASKQAQEIYDSALTKTNLKVEDDKITLDDEKLNGLLIDVIDVDDLDFIRRFIWESEVPEGTDFRMSIKTSVEGDDWSDDWSELSKEDWYYLDINKPVKKVMYMAEFSRSEFDYGFNVENLDRSVDELKKKEELLTTQQETDLTRAYLHLYQGGQDRGRYLGSLIDNSGMAQDLYYFTILTDQMAFVSERYRGKREGGDYVQAFNDFIKSSNIKLFFVDEGKKDPSQRILGRAHLVERDNNQNQWIDRGKYLNSLIDISGKHSDRMYPVKVTIADDYFKFKGVDVGERETTKSFDIFRGGNDDWVAKTNKNTKLYQDLDAVKNFQQNLRVKYVPLEDSLSPKDEFAKLRVNDKDQGYYIGSNVNISGAHSDVFFPLWLSSKKSWVGAGELIPHIFFTNTETKFQSIRTPQSSEENSRDFATTDSVKILRGNHQLSKNQQLAVYVDLKTAESGEEKDICQDFDRLVIKPENINLAIKEDYQFNILALSKDGGEIDLEQLNHNITTTGGSIDQDGYYQAPAEPGEYQITLISDCDGQVKADILVSGEEIDQPTITGSPQLFQVGLSSGYSVSDDQPTIDQPRDEGSPDQIPGWVKGGLIKTGTDLIVLIVVTILIVVGLIYLVSLLKERDGLSDVDSKEKVE